jgi:thiamine-phosphate pyrophosphorylase
MTKTMQTAMTAERVALAERVAGTYLLTPDIDAVGFAALQARLDGALAAGVSIVQYRNKRAEAGERSDQARTLRDLVHARGALFIVNDDIDLALEIRADGVHLGRDDGDIAAARRRLPHGLLGVSCYDDIARAETAAAAGADILAFGSVFVSGTKPLAVRASLDLLRHARERFTDQRIVAIGGIDVSNIRSVSAAGAHAAALISSVFDAGDPGAAVRQLQQAFHEGQLEYDSQRTTV